MALVCGCNSPHAAPADGPLQDVMSDVAIDGTPDAPADAMPDAPSAPSASPACGSTPTILIDVSPKQIVNMARSGDTLYVSAAEQPGSTNATVYTIDLATGTQPQPPFTTTGQIALWPSDGDVFGAEYLADGTVWQFHPGSAPVAVVQHRRLPGTVTAEGGYVYWSEAPPASSSQDVAQRQLITGGQVEAVISCSSITRLVIDGTNVYCASTSGVQRGLKDGTGLPEGISFPNAQLFFTMIKDGTALYVPEFGTGKLYRIDTFGSAGVAITTVANSPRIGGLAATSDYFYTADIVDGIRRTHRTTLVQQGVYAGQTGSDPVLWNNELLFEAANPILSGMRYVMRCVN